MRRGEKIGPTASRHPIAEEMRRQGVDEVWKMAEIIGAGQTTLMAVFRGDRGITRTLARKLQVANLGPVSRWAKVESQRRQLLAISEPVVWMDEAQEYALQKQSVRKRSGRFYSAEKCSVCGTSTRVQRHHSSYESEAITPLCQQCHVNIHKKDGTWGPGKIDPQKCEVCGTWFAPKDSHKYKTCGIECLRVRGRENAQRRWGLDGRTE